MTEDQSDNGLVAIGWVDYIIIAASLLVCVWIGLRKDKKSEKDKELEDSEDEMEKFTVGKRNMSMLPVAFSLMATLLSGNSITGAIGEGYRYGILTNFYVISGLVSKVFVGYAIVPIFHAIKYVSIYEYVERRFDRSFRLIFSGLYIVSHVVYLGITLYSAALSLSTVSNIPYWVNVVAIGLVCAFYCALGGLKAIIWTDVFQAGLMFFCIMTIIIKGTWDVGGIGVVFERSFSSPKAMDVHFQLTEDSAYRYSMIAVLISGVVDTFRSTVISQAGAQRLICVDSPKTARRALIVGALLIMVFKFMTSFAAMAVYANFNSCDPILRTNETGIRTEDQIFIYAVARFVSHIPGLQGLALAGLISATLSTCSSFINAFAAITLEDFVKPFFPKLTRNDKMQAIVCKISTLIYAVLAIALSFTTPYLGGVVKTVVGVLSSLAGPMCGVMVLGFFFSRADSKACKIASVVSLIFVLWITMGAIIYTKEDMRLPSGLHGCPGNYSVLEDNIAHNASTGQNMTVEEKPKDIFPLYLISFMWYGPIGMAMTCVLGIALSFVFGGKKCTDTRLLCPWFNTKWSWTNSPNRSQANPEEGLLEHNQLVFLPNAEDRV